jgi:hypothetical protein
VPFGPLLPLVTTSKCCGAARQSGHSLQLQNLQGANSQTADKAAFGPLFSNCNFRSKALKDKSFGEYRFPDFLTCKQSIFYGNFFQKLRHKLGAALPQYFYSDVLRYRKTWQTHDFNLGTVFCSGTLKVPLTS